MRLFLALLAVAIWTSPAHAEIGNGAHNPPPVSGNVTGSGGEARINVPGSSARGGIAASGSGSAAAPTSSPWITFACTYYAVGDGSVDGHGGPIDTSTLAPGTPVWAECSGTAANGSITEGGVVPWNPAAPAPITAQDLAQIALAQLVLPTPAYEMAPPPNRQLTGLPTWLHVGNWTGQQATASAAGIVATVHAQPRSATWRFPDGSITCHDAGERWTAGADPAHDPACTFVPVTATFTRHADHDQASVEVTWRVWWTSNLGHNEPLGTVTRTATFAVTTAEYQVTVS